METNPNLKFGFTLIELSIVLVIIGLIIGGVLVGRDLIAAATIRSQISQIEKYQAAVNTFRSKYGYLPGDIPDPLPASMALRLPQLQEHGAQVVCRDGNGILTGMSPANGCILAGPIQNGEPVMVWVDLSTAGLIEGGFNTATPDPLTYAIVTATSTPGLSSFYPVAKIGGGNYVVISSGGATGFGSTGDGLNYFAVTGISSLSLVQDYSQLIPIMGITVAQAYAIDAKIDDNYPMSGSVIATGHMGLLIALPGWDIVSGHQQGQQPGLQRAALTMVALSGPQHYSTGYNNGSGVNCVLSFRFR